MKENFSQTVQKIIKNAQNFVKRASANHNGSHDYII